MKKIEKAQGTTPTERALSLLCDKTFLNLWSYANLFTPEGRKNGKGRGKELCDLLAIVENHVILFSDKDISFNTKIDISIAWKRWRNKAIIASASQLYGADKWVRERGHELYLDELCEHQFPLDIPSPENLVVHLVAVTKNSYFPARDYFGSNGTGSFILTPAMENSDVEKNPFCINDINIKKTFVHVFDEVTIKIILDELDTATDFVRYLTFKEMAIRKGQINVVSGEEDLLAFYLANGGFISDDPLTPILSKAPKSHQSISLVEGGWSDYLQSDSRRAMREVNRVSYYWDELVSNMASHIVSGTTAAAQDKSTLSHELAIRYLAAEGRLSRQQLSKAFLEKLHSVPMGIRSARVCFSTQHPDRCFILLIFPRQEGQSLEDYRRERAAATKAYAFVAPLKYPNAKVVTVIGTDPIGHGTRSEDIISIQPDSLTEEDLRESQRIQSELSVLTDMHQDRLVSYGDQLKPLLNISTSGRRAPSRRKVGRNDSCPCGSGKKYKRCCLARRMR